VPAGNPLGDTYEAVVMLPENDPVLICVDDDTVPVGNAATTWVELDIVPAGNCAELLIIPDGIDDNPV
jgi:hypothetical protein